MSFVLSGMQGAISAHASIAAEDLRAPILSGVYAVLDTLSSGPDAQTTGR